MSNTVEEIEREAESTRQRVSQTADALKDKMSPSHMIDDFTSYMKNSNGMELASNFGGQIRDNPLPLAFIGAGLAWLAFGGGPGSRKIGRYASDTYERYTDDKSYGESAGPRTYKPTGSTSPSATGDVRKASKHDTDKSKTADILDKAGSAASSVGDSVSEAAASAGETIGDAAASARDGAERAGHYIRAESARTGRRARRTFLDTLEDEPLIIGMLGIAAGAAIGAMLPRSQYEDEYIGPYRDQLRDDIKDVAAEGVEEAKDVAAQSYKAAKKEAGKQDFTDTSEKPLAKKVAKVAKTTAQTAEARVRKKTRST